MGNTLFFMIYQPRRRAQYSTDAAAASFFREKEKQAAETC